MTILTKPVGGNEKKKDGQVEPLANEVDCPNGPKDIESNSAPDNVHDDSFLILTTRTRHLSSGTYICLLLAALLVVTMGIIGGKFLYDEVVTYKLRKYQNYIELPFPKPFDTDDTDMEIDNVNDQLSDDDIRGPVIDIGKMLNHMLGLLNAFKDDKEKEAPSVENFRQSMRLLNSDDEQSIEVYSSMADSSNVQNHFIHTFSKNLTGIVLDDRCWVMPLDHALYGDSLLSLWDSFVKQLNNQYYNVNMTVLPMTMRQGPNITDTAYVGQTIKTACDGKPIYELVKYVSGVYKRSIPDEKAEGKEMKLVEYSSKNYVLYKVAF